MRGGGGGLAGVTCGRARCGRGASQRRTALDYRSGFSRHGCCQNCEGTVSATSSHAGALLATFGSSGGPDVDDQADRFDASQARVLWFLPGVLLRFLLQPFPAFLIPRIELFADFPLDSELLLSFRSIPSRSSSFAAMPRSSRWVGSSSSPRRAASRAPWRSPDEARIATYGTKHCRVPGIQLQVGFIVTPGLAMARVR